MNKQFPSLLILAVLGLAVSVPGCKREEVPAADAKADQKPDEHHDEVKLSPEAVKRYGVQLGEAKREILVPTFIAPARVTLNTDAMAHVGSPHSGRALEVRVKKGDAVKKGDTLLVIESPEFGQAQSEYLQRLMAVSIARSGVDIARPAVESAQRTVDIAQSSYDRGKKLLEESQGITITEVQKREADLRAAQASLKAAEAEVKRAEAGVMSAEAEAKAAENRLHLLGLNQAAVEALAKSNEIQPRYSIVAPMDGHVLEREVTLGELVSPDKEALVVLADLSTMWVIADVPEVQLKDIAVGSEAQIHLVATGQQTLSGKVSFVDTILDPSTRSARVRIEVNNKDGFIRPGMFAQVEIKAGQHKEQTVVLVIPEDAVQTVEGSSAVFVPVKGEESTFAKRPVSVGKAVGGMVPVVAGLEAGETIVVRGSFILKAELGKGSAEDE